LVAVLFALPVLLNIGFVTHCYIMYLGMYKAYSYQ